MRINSHVFFLASTLFFLLPVTGQTGATDKEINKQNSVVFDCGETAVKPTSSRFKQLDKLALELDTKLCKSLLTIDGETVDMTPVLLDFGQKSERYLLGQFTDQSVQSAIKSQFQIYKNEILKHEDSLQNNTYPKLSTKSIPPTLYFSPFSSAVS